VSLGRKIIYIFTQGASLGITAVPAKQKEETLVVAVTKLFIGQMPFRH